MRMRDRGSLAAPQPPSQSATDVRLREISLRAGGNCDENYVEGKKRNLDKKRGNIIVINI